MVLAGKSKRNTNVEIRIYSNLFILVNGLIFLVIMARIYMAIGEEFFSSPPFSRFLDTTRIK
jgi:hypothetical protein